VIDRRYLPLIQVAQIRDQEDVLRRRRRALACASTAAIKRGR